MLFTLGIGSVVALQSAVVTVIVGNKKRFLLGFVFFINIYLLRLKDQFYWKHWKVVVGTCCGGFLLGLMYLTPVIKKWQNIHRTH